MNKQIIVLLIIVQSMFSFSQKINGEYWNKQYFMKFTKDSIVNFHLFTTGGLAYPIFGKGNYVVKGNLLYIRSKPVDTIQPSRFKVLNMLEGNQCVITVKDVKGNPLKTVNIVISDKKNKYMIGARTGDDGIFPIQVKPEYDSIEFTAVGYDDLKIPVAEISGKNVEITMVDYLVYDKEVLVYYLYVNDHKKLILQGPLAEKYINLIQKKKIKEYNKLKAKDYFAPIEMEFVKK